MSSATSPRGSRRSRSRVSGRCPTYPRRTTGFAGTSRCTSGSPSASRACEYRAPEFERLCRRQFARVELYGLFHARKLRVHERALRLGWDAVHPRLGLTERFYGWLVPAIGSRDFALLSARTRRLERALDF